MQGIITINDPRYPKLLREINDPPKKLYYKGNWSDEIFENCLAVVGSRRMTSYGRQITEKLITQIVGAGLVPALEGDHKGRPYNGITIVSGFMFGIDAAAHQTALDIGARTIAVMPCGIERIHPEYQTKLYADILENNGLVISEFEGDSLPAFWTYPKRNRIIAGLSKATMVIEAGLKSGSLITANLAKKYKRKVFAVPGPLTSVLSEGICQLIKDGAEVVTGAKDVLAYYGIGIGKMGKTDGVEEIQGLSFLEQQIIQKLQQEPVEIDVLSRLLGISSSELGTTLSFMELKGLVIREQGKYYVH